MLGNTQIGAQCPPIRGPQKPWIVENGLESGELYQQVGVLVQVD